MFKDEYTSGSLYVRTNLHDRASANTGLESQIALAVLYLKTTDASSVQFYPS